MSEDKKCIACGSFKSEGKTSSPTKETKRLGIPTGFVCQDCIDEVDKSVEERPDIPLDLSNCSTPKEAVHKCHQFLEMISSDSAELLLLSPEESSRKGMGSAWTILWESGSPSEWASNLLGERSMYASELGLQGSPQVVGLYDNNGFHVTQYRSFDLQFQEN